MTAPKDHDAVVGPGTRCWNCASSFESPPSTCPVCGQPQRDSFRSEPGRSSNRNEPVDPSSARRDGHRIVPPNGGAPPAAAGHQRSVNMPGEAPTASMGGNPPVDGPRLFDAPGSSGASGGRIFAPAAGAGRGSPSGTDGDAPADRAPGRLIDVDGAAAPPLRTPAAPPPGPVPPGLPPPGRSSPGPTASSGSAPPGPGSGGIGQAPAPPPIAPAPSPAGGPTALPASKAASLIGVVDGDVSVDHDSRPLRGVLVFAAAMIAAAVLAIVIATGMFARWLPEQIGQLVPAVIMILFLLFIIGLAFGGSPGGMIRGGGRAMGGATVRGASLALKGVAGGLRAGGRGMSGTIGSTSRLSSDVVIRRFRVRSLTNELVACIHRGDLTGDEIRHGDYVMVRGRRTRHGHLVVQHVEILQSPSGPVLSVVRTRAGGRLPRLLDRVLLAVGVVLAVAVIVAVARMIW